MTKDSHNRYPDDPMDLIKIMQEHMPSANKTGYEIRLKLLELAQTQAFQPAMAKAHAIGVDLVPSQIAEINFPTSVEVLNIAKEFNKFVTNKQD